MKDFVILFIYMRMPPTAVCCDPNMSAVGMERNSGKVYDLYLFDDENCDSFIKVEGEITFERMRSLALRGAQFGLVKDPAAFDALNELNWREFLQQMKPSYHYVLEGDSDEGERLQLRMPRTD